MVTMTAAGACLRAGTGSLHDFAIAFSAPGQLRPMKQLTGAVRGQPVGDTALGQPLWDYYRDHPDEGAAFAGAMSGVSAMLAGQVTAAAAVGDSRRIVDVGGGHGTLLRALLAAAPQAEGVVLDLPEVVSIAPPAERIRFVGGDFRAEVPPGGDVYVLSHVLHDWDDDGVLRILGACRRAAPGSSRLLIVEILLADQPGPVMPELLNLHMLVMSGGSERSADQYRHLLGAAGWQLTEVISLPSGQSLLSARPR
jgi:O-methyltransferase domain